MYYMYSHVLEGFSQIVFIPSIISTAKITKSVINNICSV